MKRSAINASIAVILGLGMTLTLSRVCRGGNPPAVAAPALSIAKGSAGLPSLVEEPRAEGHIDAPSVPAAELHVCPSGCTYSSIQDAVDAANEYDVIKVATGTYTDVNNRGGLAQIVYISKTVTVRGGYTTDDWTTSNPEANPTTLDAQGQGRVIYVTGASAPGAGINPTIEGLRVTGGDATGLGGSSSGDSGGGILVINAALTMRDNQIYNHTATFGGGLYFSDSANTTLTGNTISNNTGKTLAGGLYFRNSPGVTLTANTISNNEADHIGGGQKRYGGVLFDHSEGPTLMDNIISDNKAADWCGGVCLNASPNALLEQNTIISNSAGSPGFPNSALGGGVFLVGSGDVTLSGNKIMDNNSLGLGGGLYLESSTIVLINNVIAGNQTDVAGSGLYVAGSSPRLLHTTIARNTGGDGSGVYVMDEEGTYSTVALTNTILVSHSIGISVTGGNTLTVNAVLWYATPITVSQSVTAVVMMQNQREGDPAFATDGYHLTIGSAAIDAGVDGGVTSDIDGDSRPLGSSPDVGADEIWRQLLHLPMVLRNAP